MTTKNSVLALFENNRGRYVSGEFISKQLNVTRNAVWKAVRELVKNGYRIQAITNKGYFFYDDNDILSVQGISPFLSAVEYSDRIHVFNSLESTNITAKELAASGAEHGAVVIADSQTAGRGRFDRSFFSPPGHGIYMSFILHPTKLWSDAPTIITSFAAVAVCRAIEALTDKSPQIKWVNDVFLSGKKICGILTEAVTDFESGNVQWAVSGIGINFSAPKTVLPEELRHVIGAIFTEETPTITRNQLTAEVINQMMSFGSLDNIKEILKEYKRRLFMLGGKVQVISLTESYEAIALDIDDIGRLIVKKTTGEVVSLSTGEISVRA